MLRALAVMLVAAVAATAPAAERAPGEPLEEPLAGERPRMRQLTPRGPLDPPPSRRELVDARRELRERFREPLSHVETATGALRAAVLLVAAAGDEREPALKWLMFDEARRLGVAAGDAQIVARAVLLASSAYDFDALETEMRSLAEIPLRGVDPVRAAELARVAENLATRAETDGRASLAVSAQSLAVRGWQRSGNAAMARQAAARLEGLHAAERQR
ncbi:MAG: hypothetical protein EBZ59_04220 [Planctomycetia bacterium]|nr:hypothetical protein [Planctomycetia bacterium]